MNTAKDRIRVIKRAEREQRLQENEAEEVSSEVEAEEAKGEQRAPTLTIKEWVNEYLHRQTNERSGSEIRKLFSEETMSSGGTTIVPQIS